MNLPKSVDDVTRAWCRTEGDRRAVIDHGCTFWLEKAEYVRDYLRTFCRHSKGRWAGQPLDLLDWQWRDLVGPTFGWYRPDGTRRIRVVYCEVGKKNGKSTCISGLGCYLLTGDGEPGPLVGAVAYDRDQAGIVFGEAVHMVSQSPQLDMRLKVLQTQKKILYPTKNGEFRALSKESPKQEGENFSALLIDELHTWKTREMWDVLEDAGEARTQPLKIVITTAGSDRSSICWEQHCYAEQARDGIVDDPGYLGIIYAADPEDDWTDPATWAKANPSLGEVLTVDRLAEVQKRAERSNAAKNNFLRRRLNIWTSAETAWLDLDAWDACPSEATPEALEGCRAWAGLDLASTTDVAALAMLFPWPEDREGDGFSLLWRFWLPQGALTRRAKEQRVRLEPWVDSGHITTTPGKILDYERIQADVLEMNDKHPMIGLALDPWNATQIGTQLEGEGLPVVLYRQGYKSMSEPAKRLEGLVLEGLIDHGGNPVARWMADNTAVEQDAAGNIKPSRKASHEKIDGIVAAVMAVGLSLAGEGEEKKSIYEDRGLIAL